MAPAWDSKGCPYLGSPLRIDRLLCATRTAQRAVGALPIHTSALKHASQPAARATRGARSHVPRPSPCRNVKPDPRRPLSRGQIKRSKLSGRKNTRAGRVDRGATKAKTTRRWTCSHYSGYYSRSVEAFQERTLAYARHATHKEHCWMMNAVCLRAMMSSMVMTLAAFPRKLAALPKFSEVAPFSITTSSSVGLETATSYSRFAIQACRSALRGDWLRCSLVAKFRQRSFPHPS